MEASLTSARRLFARATDNGSEEPTRSLSGGAIAGIIIGIIIVFALLAALLMWRMYTYKTNRDFFNGRPNRPFPSQRRQRGHIRSTRRQLPDERQDSIIDMHDDDVEEKHLTHDAAAVPHSHLDMGEQGEYYASGESSYPKSPEQRYPSETNRASWWWRPQRAASPPDVQAEIMQSDHDHQHYQGPSSTVGNVNDADADPHAYQPDPIAAHPAAVEAEQSFPQHEHSKPPRAGFRQGCTTQ